MKRDAVALVGDEDNLGTESGADELCLLRLGDGVEQRRDGCSVLSVEVGVDLVKDDERRRLGGLKGKDEAEGAETCLARYVSRDRGGRVRPGKNLLFCPPLSC